jgi:hypothetical protein
MAPRPGTRALLAGRKKILLPEPVVMRRAIVAKIDWTAPLQ